MVKLKDIAKHLGLSVSTVSYSMNNDPRIPAATKQRVLDAAEELGYIGRSGKGTGTDYKKQVVLCVNSLSGSIYSNIIDSLNTSLSLNGCELVIYLGTEISRLKWFDGLFVLNPKISDEEIRRVVARKIPVVVMDRETDDADVSCVTVDNFNGCNAVTKAAIDAGARSFMFVGGPTESYESRYRYEGFLKALSDSLLSGGNRGVLQTDFTYEGGLNACRYVLSGDKCPDAIVCANDETAMGIIDGLKANPDVLGKIIVTGFDGSAPAQPVKFLTARADHKYWATTAVYTLMPMFTRFGKTNVKIPVSIIKYNI